MSGLDQTQSMNQAINSMRPFFREQTQLETAGTVTAMTWLLGGLFNNVFLYFLSMMISIGVLILIIILETLKRNISVSIIHMYAFRRLIVAFIANWAYTSGTKGKSEIDIGTTIKINPITETIMISLLIIWFASRYSESIDRDTTGRFTVAFIILRGMIRGALLTGVFYAIFSDNEIPDNLHLPLLVLYIVEPFVYLFYSAINKTYSSVDMVMGSARLPAVALRESFIANLIILTLTLWFKGFSGDEWSMLQALYIVGVVFAIFSSIDAVKKFNENPLGTGGMSDFLNNGAENMQNLDLSDKLGHVIDTETVINISKSSSLNLSPGSILVPLGEKKGMVTTMIIGKSENIVEKNKEKISQTIDGVSTALIPVKNLNNVRKNFTAKSLESIDLARYGLPNLETIKSVAQSLGISMDGWIGNVKKELLKFKLSNYGVTELDGKTTVNLPGIFVAETPESTQVKVMGIRVYETPTTNTVRIGNFLTVVEFPKMQFVSLPGITVMEMKGVGTAVNIFGFKISDKLSAERLDEFRKVFLKQLDSWEAGAESQLGRIIADPNASGLMSMSWDGDFKPMIQGRKKIFGDHPALGKASQASRKLIPGVSTSTTSESETKLIELTGIGTKWSRKEERHKKREERKEKRKERKRKGKRVSIELDTDELKKQIKSPVNQDLDVVKASLEKAKKDIDKKLMQIDREMDSKTKKKYDVDAVVDADYEIVDDEDYKIIDDEE